MRAIGPWLLALAVLPRVEDPWPDTLDLDFLATSAGAGALLALLAFAGAEPRCRERAILWGNVIGFVLGSVFYLVALLVQVFSNL
ncbi:MAG TPA: hypothetical protein VF729_11010 [Solirubrobacterales bacterium]